MAEATIDELAQRLAELRQQRAELKAQMSAVAAEEEQVAAAIREALEAQGLTSAKTSVGTVYISRVYYPRLAEGHTTDEVVKWLRKRGRLDLIETKPSWQRLRTFVRELVEAGKRLPAALDPGEQITVGLRKK